ncbi:MAG: hypothetical protein C0501_26985, partial [Isosphaera sp.]|nr:hypothetical protein [Isosphaera sp.]
MWRWARRWADWVRDDIFPLARVRRGGCAVHVRHEAGGQSHAAAAVPWSAEAVTVEVVLRLPPSARRKTDFVLRFPDAAPVPAEAVRPDADDRHRVSFRLPVPPASASGEVLWRRRPVAPVVVRVLTADAFLGSLEVVHPTLAVRLGGQAVPARAFVPTGGRGLVASAVLRSPHGLAPLADLGLRVEFVKERTGRAFAVPVALTAGQRGATAALVTAACPRVPRAPGGWVVAWRAGGRVLAVDRAEAVPARAFEAGVRVVDVRFAVAGKDGVVRLVRQPPAPGTADRVGPCFVVAGADPGAAGLCRLEVLTVTPGAGPPARLAAEEVLVTDAPTGFAPGLLGAADLARVGGFELRLGGRVLGAASLSPVPPAALTAEGGFKPPPDFTWTAAAEEELQDRLRRLG